MNRFRVMPCLFLLLFLSMVSLPASVAFSPGVKEARSAGAEDAFNARIDSNPVNWFVDASNQIPVKLVP
jgi:hypothetical protein